MAVRVADGIGDLARQAEAGVEGQSGGALAEEVVKAHLVAFATEENGGTELVFLEIEGAEDARMVERFEDLEFLQSGAAYGFLDGLVCCGDSVEANAAYRVGGGVRGVEVLIGEESVLFNEFFEDI